MKIKQEGITPFLLTLSPLDPVRYYDNITDKFNTQISNCIYKAGGIEFVHSEITY